jgi:hypothetical protein
MPTLEDATPELSRLWVVIVNYQTPQLTLDCLASLHQERQQGVDLIVRLVDNASEDHSIPFLNQAIIEHQWQSWVRFEPLPFNGGFAYGSNAVMRQALESPQGPDYILLLNPDTVVRAGAIVPLVEFLDTHPQVGLVGSRLEEPDGTPQSSAFRFPSFWTELDQGLRLGLVSELLEHQRIALPIADQPHPADWLSGASLMLRRTVLESVGLMDEDYFLYFEEVDFCHRAKQAGWDCWSIPASRVVHLVGQSSGLVEASAQPQQRRPPYWFNSRRRYFVKFHGWLYAALTDLAWMVGFVLWRSRRRIQRKPDTDPPYFLQDFFHHSVWLKGGQM